MRGQAFRAGPATRIASPGLSLAEGNGGHTSLGRLETCADGAGAADVVREIRAGVDAAQHQVGSPRVQEAVESDEHAVGRRAVDCEASLPAWLDLHVLPPAQRAPASALIRGGRDHPHVLAALTRRAFQYRQSAGVDSVVVDDDDTAFSNAHCLLGILDSTGSGLYTQSRS